MHSKSFLYGGIDEEPEEVDEVSPVIDASVIEAVEKELAIEVWAWSADAMEEPLPDAIGVYALAYDVLAYTLLCVWFPVCEAAVNVCE